jgi:hypothetical protein
MWKTPIRKQRAVPTVEITITYGSGAAGISIGRKSPMFMTIAFPWPVPSANLALTVLAGNGNRVRVADMQVDYREPVSVETSSHRLGVVRSK